MPDYKLRSTKSSEDETSIHESIEKLLCSEEFISRISSRISESLMAALDSKVKTLTTEVSQLKSQLMEANAKVESLEQYSRINNLRLYGVKEEKDENIMAVVTKVCTDKLNITVRPEDIDIAHRLRAKENGIRPIIIRFVNRTIKKLIYKNKSKLKGTKIVLKEDLTPFRVSLLKKLSKVAPTNAFWTNDGIVFCKSDNKIYRINSFNDISRVWSSDPAD